MESKTHEKLDKIMEDVSDIKVTMARNTASLEIHMKRSDMLEEKLEPVEKHVAMVEGALKLIGLVGIIVGIIAGIVEIMRM